MAAGQARRLCFNCPHLKEPPAETRSARGAGSRGLRFPQELARASLLGQVSHKDSSRWPTSVRRLLLHRPQSLARRQRNALCRDLSRT